MGGHVERTGDEKLRHHFSRNALREETTSETRRRWKDNINVDIRWIGRVAANVIHLAVVRFQWRASVNTVTDLHVPFVVENFFTRLGAL
jgi:hypothetical protein